MNIFKRILSLKIFLFVMSSFFTLKGQVAPHSEEIRISKDLGDNYQSVSAYPWESRQKSISFEVRYYEDEFAAQRALGNSHMRFQDGDYIPDTSRMHVSVWGENVATDILHMPNVAINHIYENYKQAISSNDNWVTRIQWEIDLHFPGYDTTGMTWPKICRDYKHSGIILVACEKEKEEAQKILDTYKTIFKKIAQEVAGVTYQESHNKNGNIVECRFITGTEEIFCQNLDNSQISVQRINTTSPWTKFKNFLWNEKTLYAMAGLSALYFGYEYLNQ